MKHPHLRTTDMSVIVIYILNLGCYTTNTQNVCIFYNYKRSESRKYGNAVVTY